MKKILLVLFIINVCFSGPKDFTPREDSLALVALLESNPQSTLGWSKETPITTWDGVKTYSNGQVSKLNLTHKGITTIPLNFFQLPLLIELDLSHNQISELPNGIYRLTTLAKCNLSNNQIREVPSSVEYFSSVYSLDLSHNEITAIHPAIFMMRKLAGLYLSHNKLSSLPTEIRTLPELSSIVLSHNEFTSIPQFIETMPKIRTLHFDNNRLSLTVVEETIMTWRRRCIFHYGTLSPHTDLSGNPVYHCLLNPLLCLDSQKPAPLYVSTDSTHIFVQETSSNNFYQWFQNDSLIHSDRDPFLAVDKNSLTQNHFRCEVSNDSVSDFPSYVRDTNYYSGWFCDVPDSSHYNYVFHTEDTLTPEIAISQDTVLVNPYEGYIHPLTRDSIALESMVGSFTYIDSSFFCDTDTIFSPTNLAINGGEHSCEFMYKGTSGTIVENRLVEINVFDLHQDLPEIFLEMKDLQSIIISSREFCDLHSPCTPKVPEEIFSLPNLTDISLFGISIESIPESVGELTNLKTIYILSNNFSNISEEIGNCLNLEDIYIHNSNMREIPTALYSLPKLSTINLNANQITTISNEIIHLQSLSVLDISSNPITYLSKNILELPNLTTFRYSVYQYEDSSIAYRDLKNVYPTLYRLDTEKDLLSLNRLNFEDKLHPDFEIIYDEDRERLQRR